eukprot:TRINITY_DN7761_c0_g1_i3.p1 TRINITY_DN7761_c0_g1~~TRINITY_DN7761_c0_g1_i3.p1  ORF type:complete len:334 (+),score=38.24 TRINITY_DN7761_c0_g1_i3:368-1369(+)
MEYILTPNGMVNSNRNTSHNFLTIGRQQMTPEGIIPNDICLSLSDRATSRIHSKIDFQYGFVCNKIPIADSFVGFLFATKNADEDSVISRLPKEILAHIYSFIKEPRKFWITDLRSALGTYIRLKGTSKNKIEKGNEYLFGGEILVSVLEKSVFDVRTQTESAASSQAFYAFLAQERKNKAEIHGINEYDEAEIDYWMTQEEGAITQRSTEICMKPFLKIEVALSSSHLQTHILVPNSQKEFVIGRATECNIQVVHQTISRIQSTITFNQNEWWISDGRGEKESSNGTWISVSDYWHKRQREESERREIDHESEIKISDSILKFEIFNNRKMK